MFYKLLGLFTWKAIKFYVSHKLPTKRLAAGAVVATIAAIAVGTALAHDDEA